MKFYKPKIDGDTSWCLDEVVRGKIQKLNLIVSPFLSEAADSWIVHSFHSCMRTEWLAIISLKIDFSKLIEMELVEKGSEIKQFSKEDLDVLKDVSRIKKITVEY